MSGGWEETFSKSIKQNGGKMFLKDVELIIRNANRSRDIINLNDLRGDIIKTAVHFLDERFKVEYDLIPVRKPFLSFDTSRIR